MGQEAGIHVQAAEKPEFLSGIWIWKTTRTWLTMWAAAIEKLSVGITSNQSNTSKNPETIILSPGLITCIQKLLLLHLISYLMVIFKAA